MNSWYSRRGRDRGGCSVRDELTGGGFSWIDVGEVNALNSQALSVPHTTRPI